MNAIGVLGGALTVVAFLGALRVRGRAAALRTLTSSNEPVDPRHVFLVRTGVHLDDATRRAASAHARKEGLEVLDLVPPRLAGWRAQLLLDTTDVPRYRLDRVARGATAGDAILVDAGVLERSGVDARAITDVVGFANAARRLKRYAVTGTDLAVATGLESPGIGLRERRRLLRFLFGDFAAAVVGVPAVLLALTLVFAPWWGFAALAMFHLQPLLVTLGTPIRPRDRLAYALLRTVVDLASTLGPAAPPLPAPMSDDALRSAYACLLENGTASFFDAPRTTCPICGSGLLMPFLDTRDHLQFKPGRFALARCAGCAHVFQNPRLSLDGLAFYYRDFYDGIGEEPFEWIFAIQAKFYRERVGMIAAVAQPQRWLDVGTGHGHFCCIARELLPETRFEGLDFSESVEDAERRGWIARGIRGLFPELAPGLADRGYDVVSMSHYLEHTLDPCAEIDAAAKVLPRGGLLFIELPDPDSRLGRLLGRAWKAWFQPQHLNFLSTRNLERILRERSFEPIVWHRGEAHMPSDFAFLAAYAARLIAPPLELPWRPRAGALARMWNGLVWTAALPLLAGGWLLDQLSAPLLRRAGWSNTYRVLARRIDPGETAIPAGE